MTAHPPDSRPSPAEAHPPPTADHHAQRNSPPLPDAPANIPDRSGHTPARTCSAPHRAASHHVDTPSSASPTGRSPARSASPLPHRQMSPDAQPNPPDNSAAHPRTSHTPPSPPPRPPAFP